ncbi:hypothetical protein CBER1_08177 [Cercospora berteroae]|uniref:Uncharacterized protein n=1 Tax=Cercospora berteroae TaxID=357750 RepID=A0A2S6BUU3_9PEZI|nr:hypothetical protein CBER1_08177 [Cercospora berteroae]
MSTAPMRRVDLSAIMCKSRENQERMWKCFESLSPELIQEIFRFAMMEDKQPVDATDITTLFDRIYRKIDIIPSYLTGIAIDAYFKTNTFTFFTVQPWTNPQMDSSLNPKKACFFDLNFPRPFSLIRRIELCCLTSEEQRKLSSTNGPFHHEIVSRIEQRLDVVARNLRSLISLTLFLSPVTLGPTNPQGSIYTYTCPKAHKYLIPTGGARLVSFLRTLKVREVAVGLWDAHHRPRQIDCTAMTDYEAANTMKHLPRLAIFIVKGKEVGTNDPALGVQRESDVLP